MNIKGALQDHPPYNKFLVVVGLLLIFGGIFTVMGSVICKLLYGVDVVSNSALTPGSANLNVISAFKVMQSFMSLGVFIAPPLMAAVLFSVTPAAYLRINKVPVPVVALFTVVLLFAAVPLINWMVELNSHLQLPESLKSVEEWMKAKEEEAAALTTSFFADTTYATLWANLLVMALLPAIGEELLFRGVIQRLFRDLTNDRLVSILLTAILFSALHMQFFGFLPRFMLGVAFGYLLEWTGSLWIPILAHFVNNAGAVFFAWLGARNALPFNPDTLGTGASETPLLIASVLLTAGILWYFRQKSVRSE